MTTSVPGILARIVEEKSVELQQATHTRAALENRAAGLVNQRRDFQGALRAKNVAVIAEIKKASPSKGLLCEDFRPAEIAREYEAGGAAALSVLTDRKFFQGSLADLESARGAVHLPALRKDFTISEYHVIEAAAHGADAILLIAAVLSDLEMRNLRELAGQSRMAALVEVHDGEELQSAIASGAEIIGVNNRNLHTFEVTLETSLRLADKIPSSALKISESGFDSRAQIDTLRAAGYQAFLIGEHFMKAPSPREALLALTA
ncbi:MAG: indole-3-glycerol phosphate synthase TrpC [Bryobacteraceae bacterium]